MRSVVDRNVIMRRTAVFHSTGLTWECVCTLTKYCGLAFISYGYLGVLFDDVIKVK